MAKSLASATDPRLVGDVQAQPGAERTLSPWLRLAHLRRALPTPPQTVPLQRLLDFELLLVLDGECWLWVEPAGGALRLEKGSLALIPPGLVHTWGGTAETHMAVHFDLYAQPAIAPLENMAISDRWVSYQPARFEPQVRWRGFNDALTPLVQHLRDSSVWERWIEELIAISAGRTSASLSLAEQAKIQGLLLQAVMKWVQYEAERFAPSDSIQKVRELLRRVDPTSRDAIEDLAEQTQLSATAFRTAFRAVTGQPPHRWLEQRRVDLAARRLLNTNLSVAVIAEEVGYPDTYHFSRVFRRVTGTSPSIYRRQARAGGCHAAQ